MDEILRIEHLVKTFGTNEVLRDIDFSVSKGDVISIIGASGSGKSTLLRCINMLEESTGGRILYHGRNILAGEFDEDPIFRASFDGLTSTMEPVEIKCPSESTLVDVRQNGLESAAGRLYRIQVQHQLMVSGAQHGWLVCFDRTTNDLIEFVIERDEELIAEIRSKGREFFDRFVAKRKEPPKDPTRDIYVPKGDVEIARWNQFAADYAAAQKATDALQEQIDAYTAIKNRCRDELTAMMGQFLHADFAGVAITKRALRGTVNYKDFLQAKGIAESELEAFRGKGSESWLVRVTHENLPKDFQDEELEALLTQAQPTEDLWF